MNARFLSRICCIWICIAFGLMNAASAEEPERAGLDWWAFQEIVRPRVPQVDGASNPIDAFVVQQLQTHDLQRAPHADRRTLIRRVHYDLIGLPPTFDETEDFVRDASPDAYEKLLDELLKSPHFGERWARHWLDVVRYAETNGYERDAIKPNIWKYRDWVINAFNDDMPFSQFVREQIAGDEIADRSESSVIATGMLRAGTWNDEPNDPQEYKYERLEDMVDVASTAFLSLTVKCARCHDHKFDPIPQRDYYRFAAAFWAGHIEPRDRNLMGGPTAEELGFKDVFGWTDRGRAVPVLHLLKNGDPHHKSDAVDAGFLSFVPALDKPYMQPAVDSKTTGRRLQIAEKIADVRNPLTARVYVNRLWQHLFGQGIVRTPNNFGFKADPPTHPQMLDWLAAEFMDGDWKTKRMIKMIMMSETYRQSSVHPLERKYAERDSSNRRLWKMNRRRMDAEALRDAMLHIGGELNTKMGGQSFFPRMSAGALEGFSRKSSAWNESSAGERHRRSVYMVSKRHLLLPLMTAFDFPASEKPCGRRNVTIVAPQALAMLNNEFVHERSRRLAAATRKPGGEPDAVIRRAWRLSLGRDPTPDELAGGRMHYREQLADFEASQLVDPESHALASLCHVLLNTSEFLYID